MRYSLSFHEWCFKERIEALKTIGLTVIVCPKSFVIDIKHHNVDALGSAHSEAAKFICDPVYNPIMYNMEEPICRVVTDLHYKFWCWRHKLPYFNLEQEIANGIKDYIKTLPCKEQDAFLEVTPEELRTKIVEQCQFLFSTTPASIGVRVSSNLTFSAIGDKYISWKRIHSLLFK